MDDKDIRSWIELLRYATRKAWPWLVAVLLVLVPLVFGDLQGYIQIAQYISSHVWTIYILLALPFIIILLLGALKAIGDETIYLYRQTDKQSSPLYKRLSMHAHRQLQADGLLTVFNSVEIQAMAETPLKSVEHHRTMKDAHKLDDSAFEFLGGRTDSLGNLRGRVLTDSRTLFFWTVEFSPPLTKGQRASYSYKQTSMGTFSMTVDELREKVLTGESNKAYNIWSIRAIVPTEFLSMKIEFPPNYPLTFPASGGYNVYLAASTDTEEAKEAARLRLERAFSASLDPLNDRWTLELKVQNAQIGLSYALEWTPPTKAELRQPNNNAN